MTKKSWFLAIIFILVTFNTSCTVAMKEPEISEDIVSVNSNTIPSYEKQIPEIEEYSVYFQNYYTPNLYEPINGCYLGAYILSSKNVNYDIDKFEEKTQTNHTYYMYNMNYGDTFPEEWILTCISKNKTPYIVVNAENSSMYNEKILDTFAKSFSTYNIPIFIEFCPNTQKQYINPQEYISFYRKARTSFRLNAPNVAFVWGTSENGIATASEYYPGNSFCDWVSLTIYNEISAEETIHSKDLIATIEPFYFMFQEDKPIMLNIGISHFSSVNNKYYIDETIEEIENLYSQISTKYNRIKGILYMDFNGREFSNQNNEGDDFSLTNNEQILSAYKTSINKNYFGGILNNSKTQQNTPETFLSPFSAIKTDNVLYLSKLSIQYEMNYENLYSNLAIYEDVYFLNDKTYFNLNKLKKDIAFNSYENPQNKQILIELI